MSARRAAPRREASDPAQAGAAQGAPAGGRGLAATRRRPPASGCLFVLAAPSGGGKTSLVTALLEREPGIRLSVSYTTRAPRPGETDGVHYHFVDEPRFMALKSRGEFLEHAHVHGNWYATSATWLRDADRARATTCCSRSTGRAPRRCAG